MLLLLAAAALAILLYQHVLDSGYKLTYKDEIVRYAKKYDLDPYLVSSVIHVESSNRAEAVSSVGALGLMQIMPDTGEWIADKLGVEHDLENLKLPETNIEFGCWYLNFLCERFPVQDTVLAAYNAGHNAAARWLNDPDYSKDGQNLTTIPYKETKNYVEKVNKAYSKYKKLFPDAFAA